MPAHFAQHGYATALVGKNALRWERTAQRFPISTLRGPTWQCWTPNRPAKSAISRPRTDTTCRCHRDPEQSFTRGVINGETVEYLRSQPSDQPWFLLASYSRPHFPLTAPKRLLDKYWPDNVDMPNIPPGHLEQTHRFAKGLRDNFNTQDIPPEEARKARARLLRLLRVLG